MTIIYSVKLTDKIGLCKAKGQQPHFEIEEH